MKNHIPKYLNLKQNVISLVVGTAIFAEIFILIFRPFDSGTWLQELGYDVEPDVAQWIYLGYATLAVLTAMGVIAISRTIMYKYAKRHDISYFQCGLWIAVEFISMAIIYTLFVCTVVNDFHQFFDTFERAIGYTSCILLIPYAIFLLYFSLQDKSIQLQTIQQLWHEKLSSLSTESQPNENDTFNFKDEKGELKLSVRTESLFFIEAADNYVTIHYLNSGKLQKFMLRSTLKKIEEEYKKQNLLRCHRSYVVNIKNVKVLRKAEEGLVLDFDHEKVPNIPVSKTYNKQILELFTKDANA